MKDVEEIRYHRLLKFYQPDQLQYINIVYMYLCLLVLPTCLSLSDVIWVCIS